MAADCDARLADGWCAPQLGQSPSASGRARLGEAPSCLAAFLVEDTLIARARSIAVLGVPAQAEQEQEATWRRGPCRPVLCQSV